MAADEGGAVPNPLRDNIAICLENERAKRKLNRKQFVALLREDAPEKRFSYGTYINTINKKNNITLRSLEHIAKTLDISIGDLLYGKQPAPAWVRKLNALDIRTLLAIEAEKARDARRMSKVGFANFLGLAEVTYGKISDKKANFTIDTIAAIAIGLEMKPLKFLFG
ncbi:transcriptional regulator [Ochrobactrum sp. MYb29]|uniref:transcriptional regulator n=1 Tax=Brucella pituitosa TaxID=571256 RepID=UPI000C280F7A|nr:transcriptional regulator [Brucella pituitosa]PJO48218.1 transcriptional regulator [Brucella pituitosa]PRA79371.1 transcriptional regulator [Ochrobactrum sp. MYb29]TCQ72356.1 hypothetical protein EDF68_1225 [Ochrobactrum sp. BH3]